MFLRHPSFVVGKNRHRNHMSGWNTISQRGANKIVLRNIFPSVFFEVGNFQKKNHIPESPVFFWRTENGGSMNSGLGPFFNQPVR